MLKRFAIVLCATIMICLCACQATTKNPPTPSDTETASHATDTSVHTDDEKGTLQQDVSRPEPIPRVVYTSYTSKYVREGIEVFSNPSVIDLDITADTSVDRQKENFIYEMNGKAVELMYESSIECSKSGISQSIYQSISKDIYFDDDGTRYTFMRDSDTLIAYYNRSLDSDRDTDKAIGEQEILSIAKDTLKKYTGIEDESLYTVETRKYSNENMAVLYRYRIGGYETDCTIRIKLTPSGKLVEFDARNAYLYSEWQDKITEEDIERAADVIHFPSMSGVQRVKEKLVVGNDGYLYLCVDAMTNPYDVTDENGNTLISGIADEYIYYIRVVPE